MWWCCPGKFFRPLKARFPFPFFTYFAGFVALPLIGARAGIEEPHLLDSCSSSWNRGSHEFPISKSAYTAHQRGLVLWYSFEWGWKTGSYLGPGTGMVFVVLRRRISRGKRRVFQTRTSFGPVSNVHKRNEGGAPLLCWSKTKHMSTNESLFNRQTCPETRSVPPLPLKPLSNRFSMNRSRPGKWKTLIGIGNRYDSNLQFVVVEKILRYDSYSSSSAIWAWIQHDISSIYGTMINDICIICSRSSGFRRLEKLVNIVLVSIEHMASQGRKKNMDRCCWCRNWIARCDRGRRNENTTGGGWWYIYPSLPRWGADYY